jgi:uncharacterized protein
MSAQTHLSAVVDGRWHHRGVGVGLREAYAEETFCRLGTELGWFEVITENYLWPTGIPKPRDARKLKSHLRLERMRGQAPVVFHGVSLNIGSTDPLDKKYLRNVRELAQRFEPLWISDHLCFTGVTGKNTHDLLPLLYTEDMLKHVAERVGRVQDYLGQRILLENPSTYLAFEESQFSEAVFLKNLAEQADCGLLLDINNVFVSAHNHGFNAREYLSHIPFSRVGQIHLAGHTSGKVLIDTHAEAVTDAVWQLYEEVVSVHGPRSTMIERDANFVPFSEIDVELRRASKILARRHS